MYKRYKWQER